MHRLLVVLILFLLSRSIAQADTLDDLFKAATAGDADQVEALLASADSTKMRRDMMWMLGGSHEALRRFTADWAEAQPKNAAALTARAWSLYREGFLIRGTDSIKNSWPASIETALPIIEEAYTLAERALALDPSYLPASDAVIIIGEVSGHQDASGAEAQRILSTAPNRHSLVISASTVRPDWLGNMGVKTDLCETYASQVTDAPGYTPEMCVIDAVYMSNTCCSDERSWADEHLAAYVDEPLMEDTVMQAAAENRLPPDAADRLRARLAAEDRLTVKAILSGRPDVLMAQYDANADPLRDMPALRATFDRDLASAKEAADRDPGDPATLGDLAYYHSIITPLELREVGYYRIPPPSDILDLFNAVMDRSKGYEKEMSARALELVRSSPRNRDALVLAGHYIHDHGEDPLAMATWNHSLFTNAILYSNYRYDIVGEYLISTKYDRSTLEREAKYGRAPTYDDATLTETFDCPFIQALRLLDASCDAADVGIEECYQISGLSWEREHTDPDSAFVRAQSNGSCQAERDGPVDKLRYEEVDLQL